LSNCCFRSGRRRRFRFSEIRLGANHGGAGAAGLMDTLTGTSRVNQISVNGGLPGSSLAVGLHRIYIEHRVRLSRAESSRVRGALGARRHERRRSAERPAIRWSADRPAMLLDLLAPPGRCSGCWPHDGEVDGCRRREAVFRSRRRRLDAATRWRRDPLAPRRGC
jgi:hypothetical protein